VRSLFTFNFVLVAVDFVLIENILFFLPLLTGSIFLLAGFLSLKFPPSGINPIYGYRTSSSMKSQARWDFAQPYSSRKMMKMGAALAATSLLCLMFEPGKTLSLIIAFALLFGFIGFFIWQVEKAIQSRFSNE